MKNCDIDWNSAPEWCVAHALFAFNSDISEVWVGEDKWQRLTQDKSFPYGGGGGDAHHNPTRKQFKYETPRPKWVEGELPPVGTVCEWCPNQDGWVQVEILGHDGEETWFRRAGQSISETCLRMAFFRPIRTPEQIAAEEREKAIDEMLKDFGKFFANPMTSARTIYDAGYRKQVKP